MDPVLPEFLIFYKRSQNSHILMEILQVFKMLAPKYHHFFFFFFTALANICRFDSARGLPVLDGSWTYFYFSICNN